MIDLYRTRHYNWALFIGHLVIEKAGIEVDIDMRTILDSISRFNINARYDDYKQSFYKLCTKKFTEEWIEKIKECRLWIKMKL